jgi:transposase
MSKLDQEARVTIKTLLAKGVSHCAVARMLQVTEGTVRYQAKRVAVMAVDGRSRQSSKATGWAEAIGHWREQQGDGVINLAALHDGLVCEHGYAGSLRSIQRYWKRTYPAPRLRARRRIETPPAAQSQVDWAHFSAIVVGGEHTDLLALHMVLSHSRYEAVVWSLRKHTLSWLHCHSEAFRRVGGVTATVRVDNEKTAVQHGAGAWGTINATYRRYARMLCFHVDACAPRQPQSKGKVERRVRDQRKFADPRTEVKRDLAELQQWTDERYARRARQRQCPATGRSVWESWQAELPLLGALPETLPEPFELVQTRRVGIDALVAFEARQYSVPFAYIGSLVEVRGCATTVQVIAEARIIAVHPRHTAQRIFIDPAHYEGASADRVIAPPPLGRMGRAMMTIAETAVAHRSIDLCAQLAEVAR